MAMDQKKKAELMKAMGYSEEKIASAISKLGLDPIKKGIEYVQNLPGEMADRIKDRIKYKYSTDLLKNVTLGSSAVIIPSRMMMHDVMKNIDAKENANKIIQEGQKILSDKSIPNYKNIGWDKTIEGRQLLMKANVTPGDFSSLIKGGIKGAGNIVKGIAKGLPQINALSIPGTPVYEAINRENKKQNLRNSYEQIFGKIPNNVDDAITNAQVIMKRPNFDFKRFVKENPELYEALGGV